MTAEEERAAVVADLHALALACEAAESSILDYLNAPDDEKRQARMQEDVAKLRGMLGGRDERGATDDGI